MTQTAAAVAGGTAVYAYLIGSIPAAYLVARLVRGVDIRTEGEGNVGSRNVFHVVGQRWGVVVFLAQGIRPLSWWEAEKAKKATQRAIVLWTSLLLALVALIFLSP